MALRLAAAGAPGFAAAGGRAESLRRALVVAAAARGEMAAIASARGDNEGARLAVALLTGYGSTKDLERKDNEAAKDEWGLAYGDMDDPATRAKLAEAIAATNRAMAERSAVAAARRGR